MHLPLSADSGKQAPSLARPVFRRNRRYARRRVSACQGNLTACNQEAPMLDRIGILGFLGLIIFIAWAIGWIVFGLHEGLYHLWLAVAAVLMIAQGVRRVAR